MITPILSVLEWIVWGIALLVGLWFAFGIRQVAIHHAPAPTWPTLITSFTLVALPVIFLFLPFSKLHIIWLLVLIWPLSFLAGVGYIPLVSQLLIWPAYFYASVLMVGTGVRLSSPSRQSPWAARGAGIPLRYLVKGWFHGLFRKLPSVEEEHISKLMESREELTDPPGVSATDNFEYIALNMAMIRRALEMGWRDRFSDEKTLFIACGVLDTIMHIRDGHFTVQDIAHAMFSADLGECQLGLTVSIPIEDGIHSPYCCGPSALFLNYTLQIQALIFNAIEQHVDRSGMSERDIVLGVLAKKEQIRKVLATPKEDLDACELMKDVHAFAEAFMNAPEFSDDRKAIGLDA